MTELSRIGISLDSDLLARFDQLISEQGYTNRSEAFRDLVRDRLVVSAVVAPNARVVGTVSLIYDHHARLLPEKLTNLQHAHHELISTLHAHLDGDNCLEVILLRGKSKDVPKLSPVSRRKGSIRSRRPNVIAPLTELLPSRTLKAPPSVCTLSIAAGMMTLGLRTHCRAHWREDCSGRDSRRPGRTWL